jgi:DNA-binding LacI/PurR family transcriptional regulator
MTQRATIAQVAKRARVSQATVSRVLNHSDRVDPKMASRVNKAVEFLGYTPNRYARALAGASTSTVGLVFFDFLESLFHNPYWGNALNSLYSEMGRLNLQCHLIAQSSNIKVTKASYERSEYIKFLNSRHVDAFIVVGHPTKNQKLAFEQCEIPTVIWGQPVNSASKVTYIDTDNYAGAFLATQHLISIKRRKIAIITGRLDTQVREDRLKGYADALSQNGIKQNEKLIAEGDFTRESGRRAMKSLLERNLKVDAVFASNDEMAMGAIEILRERKIKIPSDVAVIGVDRSTSSGDQNFLSTLSVNYKEISSSIVEAANDLIAGKSVENRMFELVLHLRQST